MDSMISEGGYNIVFNMLSMGIAAMLFTTIFLVMAKDRVLPRYRMAVMVSATVTGIAAYHYFRMLTASTTLLDQTPSKALSTTWATATWTGY